MMKIRAVAASLVNFEVGLIEQFKMLKDVLAVHFGPSFTDLDEEEKAMFEEVTSALTEVTKEKLTTSMRIQLKQCTRLIGKHSVSGQRERKAPVRGCSTRK